MPPLATIARTVSSFVLRSLATWCHALEWVQTGARASGTASARERWPVCDRSRIIGVSFTAAISSSPRKLSPASRFSPQPSANSVAPVYARPKKRKPSLARMPTRASSLPIMLEPLRARHHREPPRRERRVDLRPVAGQRQNGAGFDLGEALVHCASWSWSHVLSSAKVTLQTLTPASRQRVA